MKKFLGTTRGTWLYTRWLREPSSPLKGLGNSRPTESEAQREAKASPLED